MRNREEKMSRILSKEEWIRKKKIKNYGLIALAVLFMIIIFILSYFLIGNILKEILAHNDIQTVRNETTFDTLSNGIEIQNKYLTPNIYSRPQTELKEVKGVVIHYTANPGTSAQANRNYFENLATLKTTSSSSHFVIGLEGEIIQCIPLNEIAYASNERNEDTISIECCHLDETGKFNEKTYQSLVALVAKLCIEFDLGDEDIIRHYDIRGKKCPLYYVDHEDAWLLLKADITAKKKLLEVNIE